MLSAADVELILTGLDLAGDSAENDAEFGGSDEPGVARKIARDCGDLARKLRRLAR